MGWVYPKKGSPEYRQWASDWWDWKPREDQYQLELGEWDEEHGDLYRRFAFCMKFLAVFTIAMGILALVIQGNTAAETNLTRVGLWSGAGVFAIATIVCAFKAAGRVPPSASHGREPQLQPYWKETEEDRQVAAEARRIVADQQRMGAQHDHNVQQYGPK